MCILYGTKESMGSVSEDSTSGGIVCTIITYCNDREFNPPHNSHVVRVRAFFYHFHNDYNFSPTSMGARSRNRETGQSADCGVQIAECRLQSAECPGRAAPTGNMCSYSRTSFSLLLITYYAHCPDCSRSHRPAGTVQTDTDDMHAVPRFGGNGRW